jgi:hypothetical protein
MKIELRPFWANAWARSIFIYSSESPVDRTFMGIKNKIPHPYKRDGVNRDSTLVGLKFRKCEI